LKAKSGAFYKNTKNKRIPFLEGMVEGIGLKDSKNGPQSVFSPKGKVVLIFLKHYAVCSD
jgi:hypothetical protein